MAFNILSVSICKNGGKEEEEEEDDGDDERKRNTFPVVCKTDTDKQIKLHDFHRASHATSKKKKKKNQKDTSPK